MDPLGSEIRAELAPLRPAGRDGRARGALAGRRSAPRSRATPGRRASHATAPSRCTPPTRSGPSSSASARPRWPSACARRAATSRACASLPGRFRRPTKRPFRRGSRPRRRTRSVRGQSPPRSLTKSCAKVCKKRSVWALQRGAAPARSDTLPVPRKTRVLQAFSPLWRRPRQRPVTRPRTSPCSKASSRSGCGPGCTSARPASAASTTWSTRSSTTPSTRLSRATTTRSR